MLYREVVFVNEGTDPDVYREIMDIACEGHDWDGICAPWPTSDGMTKAIDYVAELYDESDETTDYRPWGGNDHTFQNGSYMFAYNTRLGYLSVTKVED